MSTFEEKRREFVKRVLAWGKNHRRLFPWRKNRTPYKILIAEIMLQRTKADQVVPVYNRFLKKFPTIEALSAASIIDVKKVLYPLGLHWRTEFLHQMAKEIVGKHGSKIPSEKKELESLRGVGDYIASAVRCFSLGCPEALLDTNTVRILGRLFGIKVTDSSRRSRRFRELYLSLIDAEHPQEFNYAMIDLGGLICTSKDPLCNSCPIKKVCRYGNRQKLLRNNRLHK